MARRLACRKGATPAESHALPCRLMEGEPFDWFDSLRSLTTGRFARSGQALPASRLASMAREAPRPADALSGSRLEGEPFDSLCSLRAGSPGEPFDSLGSLMASRLAGAPLRCDYRSLIRLRGPTLQGLRRTGARGTVTLPRSAFRLPRSQVRLGRTPAESEVERHALPNPLPSLRWLGEPFDSLRSLMAGSPGEPIHQNLRTWRADLPIRRPSGSGGAADTEVRPPI